MKFLCLAYGDEAGWHSLSDDEKPEVLANDEVIRARGSLMTAVRPSGATLTNHDRNLVVHHFETEGDVCERSLPLAGFSVIEADSVEEVIALVADTPCARARGRIEIRPFWTFDEPG